jgi:hypothetical protein
MAGWLDWFELEEPPSADEPPPSPLLLLLSPFKEGILKWF